MKAEVAKREIELLDYYLQNHTNDYSEASHTAMMMAISALSENEGDLISRKSLLNKINAYVVGSQDKEFICKLIKEMPSVENKGEWIPVSERLPEKNMACLVAVGQFNFTQMAIYSDLMRTIDHKIFYQGEYGHGSFQDITKYVKAWMPLPEPYKAESEDI